VTPVSIFRSSPTPVPIFRSTDATLAIDLDEFLNGCLSLHGPAKAIHVSTMRYELRMLVRMMNESLATSNRAAVANEQEEMSDESVDQDDDKHLS